MTEDEQVDAAFFSCLSGFLAECDVAPPPSVPDLTLPPPCGIFEATYDLLAETETLLSSLEPSRPEQGNGQEDVNALADKKKKMRNAKAAARRMRYRQKLRNEKETLQQQETELSNELSRLQRGQVEEKKSRVDRISRSVWRVIATRQKERRAEVEQTQRQLRAAVIGQARMIHQMNALLQRPRVEEEDKRLGDGDATRSGDVLFKNFIEELDAIYAQTDQVLEEAEFRVSSRMEYKPTRTWKHGVECFDSADKTVLPFGYEETCRAVSLVMMTDPEVFRYNEKPQLPEDTITVTYNVKCQLELGDTSKLVVYAAIRRYEEAGRLVFVWRALNEGEGNLSGCHTDETGWLVVRSTSPSTVLESYVRFVPMSVGDAAGNKADTDRFANVVAKSGEKDVNEMMQMLEKMLLGDE